MGSLPQHSGGLNAINLLKAFKNRYQYKGNGFVKTWLFSIAQNMTKDYFKKRSLLKYYLNFSLFIKLFLSSFCKYYHIVCFVIIYFREKYMRGDTLK